MYWTNITDNLYKNEQNMEKWNMCLHRICCNGKKIATNNRPVDKILNTNQMKNRYIFKNKHKMSLLLYYHIITMFCLCFCINLKHYYLFLIR